MFAFGSPAAQAAPPSAAVTCVGVRTEAYWASYGYDHRVYVTNNCEKSVSCSVTTSVNPDASSVDLAPKETQMLVMWRGSPASEFTAQASCKTR
jgi:hypothetical protein